MIFIVHFYNLLYLCIQAGTSNGISESDSEKRFDNLVQGVKTNQQASKKKIVSIKDISAYMGNYLFFFKFLKLAQKNTSTDMF